MDNVFGILSLVASRFRFTKVITASDMEGFFLPMIAGNSESVMVFVNGLYQNVGSYLAADLFLGPLQRAWEVNDRVDVIWLQSSAPQTPRVVRNLKGTGIAAAGQKDVEVPFVYTLGGTLEIYQDGLLMSQGAYVEKDVTHVTLVNPFTKQTRLDFRFYY